MAAASFLALIPFVAGVQAGRQPASHAKSAAVIQAGIGPSFGSATTSEREERVGTYRGQTARQWAARFRDRTRELQAARRQAHALRRTLTHTSTVTEAIGLACVAYRLSHKMCNRVYWIAKCESTLNPKAENPEPTSDASGLGQFLSSTWAGTPYARFSVFSAYANALAIAYEVSIGNSTVHWFASKRCWSAHS